VSAAAIGPVLSLVTVSSDTAGGEMGTADPFRDQAAFLGFSLTRAARPAPLVRRHHSLRAIAARLRHAGRGVADQVLRFTPMTAGLTIQRTVERADSIPIAPWAGLGVTWLYAAAALAAAFWVIRRRDA
jgi:hypothetical protein